MDDEQSPMTEICALRVLLESVILTIEQVAAPGFANAVKGTCGAYVGLDAPMFIIEDQTVTWDDAGRRAVRVVEELQARLRVGMN